MAVSATVAKAEPRSPAIEVYDRVSEYRDRHSEVIWRGADASVEALREVVADLDRGLALLDEPLHRDLAEGNLHLHYRRYNFLIDKVKVHARLGEVEAALDALEALQRIGWHPGALDRLLEDRHVQALVQTPRFQAARRREAVATRLAEAPALAGGNHDRLSEAERVAGLSRLWSEARDGFVWFDQVPELDWDQAFLDFVPQVLAAADTAAYYRILMRFAALLEDGHSSVSPPQALHAQLLSRPPMRTALVDGEVVVTAVASRVLSALGIDVGDVVLGIDGEDVHAYAERSVAPFIGASTAQDRAVRVYDYRLLAGAAETPVLLRLRKASSDTIEVRAPRNGYGRIEPPPTETFEVRTDGIAVLQARQFGSDAALRLFEEHLDDIMAARGLILDLRGNGGGSTTHGWDILTWLSAEPLQGTSSRHRVGDALDRARSGAQTPLRWRDLGGEPYRRERERTFRGPVVMLIDARTYSAAEDTAAAFRLMRRGPIIGEPSGGSTGQPLFIDLPGGGSARICVKRDEWPDGSTFVGVGVLPDIEVRPTLEDIRAGTDPVLARALALLSQTGTSPHSKPLPNTAAGRAGNGASSKAPGSGNAP
ncbi:MAG TPA: S41 family peptidase [Xanthomonadaceae bacterium]|nr:S41 family peptidase [Xanthomonadaceae bacterium]